MTLFPAVSPGDLGVFALGLVMTGAVSGLVAGMLGVGGGIVIVPVLYHVLVMLGVDKSLCMQVAIGTSLATIVPTSYTMVAAHNREGTVDWGLVRRWAIPVLAGVLIASALLGFASGRALSLVFAIAALPVALHLAFADRPRRLADRLPAGPVGVALFALIGGVSTLMGVGGGTVGAPAMTLCGVPVRRAVGTASVFGVVISIPGTIGAVIAGWHAHALPPYSLGYVNLLGFLLIAPATFLAPFGASIADQIDMKRVRIVFAVFIVIATGRMLFDALA